MTGCRKSDQEIQISLPDFSKKDVRTLLDRIYCGECTIQNDAHFNSVIELSKLLGINTLHSGLSMSFYPDFILILSRFYPDFLKTINFIQILSRFYPNF